VKSEKNLIVFLNFMIFYLKISRFSSDLSSKRNLTPAEISAVDAIHRAVEFNPHVPKVFQISL